MALLGKGFVTTPVGRAVWIVIAIGMTLCQMPFWLALAILPQWRPHPQWTFRQAISNRLLRAFIHQWSAMEIPTRLRFEPAAEKERFVILQPAKKHFYRGVLVSDDVRPVAVGATWFPTQYIPKSEDTAKVVLYVHGGAFVIAEGRSADANFSCTTLANNLNAHVLSVSYRLSCNPGCPFPAALQDVVTAYHFLLHQKRIPADRLVVTGDSAGANLVIALLRYIADNQGLLAPPSAVLLFSPWVDLGSARDLTRMQQHHSYSTDYLPANFVAWGSRLYVPIGADPGAPYLSPIGHPFRSATPLFVCLGELETLYEQGLRFAHQMATVAKDEVDVKIHIEPEATHAFLNVGKMTGFESAAAKAVQVAKEWMDARTE